MIKKVQLERYFKEDFNVPVEKNTQEFLSSMKKIAKLKNKLNKLNLSEEEIDEINTDIQDIEDYISYLGEKENEDSIEK